jgi:serine/threonine-protein kinase
VTLESDASDPRLGATVGGKYLVASLLGRGGMGAVYRATHIDLGEPLAIKFLHPMFVTTPELRSRFRREAVALARLRHPGIVSLLDFGEHEGEPYMVMELVRGRSLADVIAESRVSLPFVASIFDQLLEVLEVAHSRDIVHRDIKPSNVMVVATDRVKLLDFGLVQLPGASIERITATGTVHGTPDYMSPEQCEGKETGAATDVYSVGVMLYECLAGKPPFDGAGAAQLMAQHLFVEPLPLAARGAPADLPRALEDLVHRAMAKTPDARPTAAVMRSELAAIIRGTDPLSLAEGAARERARVAALSRGERAVTGRVAAAADTPARSSARIDLRMADGSRASLVRSALAVAGIPAVIASRGAADTPNVEPRGERPDIVVLSANDGLDELHRAVLEGVATIVLDVRDVEQTRAMIRAGASDLMAVETPDAELAARVIRLLRRHRRE